MDLEELRERRERIDTASAASVRNMKKIAEESRRVADVAKNVDSEFADIEREFEKKTGLNGTDIAFLFVAVAMQLARQFLLTRFPIRLDDQAAADSALGHAEEHSDRHHKRYNPSLEEILTNPVPFDANIGADGALAGGGDLGHRATAIGHDPIMGLIVGTANIATSTLTNNKWQSYHIYTNAKRDVFNENAQTPLVFGYTARKLLHEGLEGKKKVALALVKEIVHLNSDLNTKHSLPLPFISSVDPKLASRLADIGLDMANVVAVGKQAALATMINMLVGMVHGLFNDGADEMERKLYSVRTRKVITYSNLIAVGCNFAYVGITKDFRALDIGGFLVAIYRVATNRLAILEIKRQFVLGRFNDLIRGEDLQLENVDI